MVNLTTLAPDIVAAIPDQSLPNHITLLKLAVNPRALWDEQREILIPHLERPYRLIAHSSNQRKIYLSHDEQLRSRSRAGGEGMARPR